ncbi:MAG: hypothetical protein J7501_03385, partial [Bdellovibrio sp.]|nr:hypothetical protein [Bdellovibrio sp.]
LQPLDIVEVAIGLDVVTNAIDEEVAGKYRYKNPPVYLPILKNRNLRNVVPHISVGGTSQETDQIVSSYK